MTRLSLLLFLTLNNVILGVGCAAHAPNTAFDGQWEFLSPGPGLPAKACLGEADVQKLRTLLIRCHTGTQ